MDVDPTKIFCVCPELPVAATDETERRLNRFFHDFADVPCERDITFAGITGRFDVENFAASRRVSQAGDNTWLTCLKFGFTNVLGRSQQFCHPLRRDCGAFNLSTRHLRRHGATDGTDLPFQFTHSSLVRVIVDDPTESFVLPFALFRLKAVLFQLSPN